MLQLLSAYYVLISIFLCPGEVAINTKKSVSSENSESSEEDRQGTKYIMISSDKCYEEKPG